MSNVDYKSLLPLLKFDDVRDLLSYIRAMGGWPDEPWDSEPGYLVLIGPRAPSMVDSNFVGWARVGAVQQLVSEVQQLSGESVDFLDAAPCIYGSFRQHLDRLKDYRERGFWHAAVPQFRAYMRNVFWSNPVETYDD